MAECNQLAKTYRKVLTEVTKILPLYIGMPDARTKVANETHALCNECVIALSSGVELNDSS